MTVACEAALVVKNAIAENLEEGVVDVSEGAVAGPILVMAQLLDRKIVVGTIVLLQIHAGLQNSTKAIIEAVEEITATQIDAKIEDKKILRIRVGEKDLLNSQPMICLRKSLITSDAIDSKMKTVDTVVLSIDSTTITRGIEGMRDGIPITRDKVSGNTKLLRRSPRPTQNLARKVDVCLAGTMTMMQWTARRTTNKSTRNYREPQALNLKSRLRAISMGPKSLWYPNVPREFPVKSAMLVSIRTITITI